ncbi:hypothetical protein BJ508DRAFT_315689 [Ascobolus immersus RN42]|uniref:Tet-like 2OG-Fe(II) oxygenase domain-containing protein n=1 Tax=Ascobolus immersus RN42 TaxID=1160509 RepID=A0A3N4HEG3_ASCIM|nr:hypothetical protein BJ508DRAFT_315689 [Ascobolus immersus RN42]
MKRRGTRKDGKNRRGSGSKKRRRKEKKKEKRQLRRRVLEDQIIMGWSIGPHSPASTTSASAGYPGSKPIIRLDKRDTGLEDALYGYVIDHDDPRLEQSFKTIDDRTSCTYSALDRDTKKVVFVAKVNLYQDMTTTEKNRFQRLFTYFAKDQAIKGHQTLNNGAGKDGGGHMNAVGWRPGYETGLSRFTADDIQKHEDQLEEIHASISSSFHTLSSLIFAQQRAELLAANTPIAGHAYEETGLDIEDCFCSNIAYMYDGFHNTVHCDNDASSYTYGMFAQTEKGTGRLLEVPNGITGFSFLVIPYRLRVLLTEIPGVIELIWRGPTDGHCTTTGTRNPYRTGLSDRMGLTCQIAKSLVARAKMYRKQFSPFHARANLTNRPDILEDPDTSDDGDDDSDYVPE